MKGRVSFSEARRAPVLWPTKRIVGFPFLLWDITSIYFGKRIQKKKAIVKMPGLFLACDMWPFYSLNRSSLGCRFKVTVEHVSSTDLSIWDTVVTGKLFLKPGNPERDTRCFPGCWWIHKPKNSKRQRAQDPRSCRWGLAEGPSGKWVSILAWFPDKVN